MLLVAAGGRWAAGMKRVRAHAPGIRPGLGAVVALTALAIALGADSRFQTAVPGYTESLQKRIERSSAADRELDRLTGRERGTAADEGLRDFGEAPEFAGISRWLNTPSEEPLSVAGLRGKVVLVDFWTYSCVNCLRTLPFLRGWDRAYRDKGLRIVGVHTPEFAFEHEADNVRGAVDRLGSDYAVALDNDYGTWNAYGNRYWPAKYLIDRNGHVRFVHFGEGAYDETERVIRTLLAERPRPSSWLAGDRGGDAEPRGHARDLPRTTSASPGSRIPTVVPDRLRVVPAPERRSHSISSPTAGDWRVEAERAVAGENARLRLRFRAKEVNLVLGGTGRVEVLLDGRARADRRACAGAGSTSCSSCPRSRPACSSSASAAASPATPSRSARSSGRAGRGCRRRSSRSRRKRVSSAASASPEGSCPSSGISRRCAARAPRRTPASPRRSPPRR